MIKIAIASDHRGFEHKAVIQQGVSGDEAKIEWIDVGCFSKERTDYPPFAYEAVQLIKNGKADLGVLVCGTGVGMAIAANRFAHIYAAVVWDEITAIRAKEEDKANVLSLPADYITPAQAVAMVNAWLQATFLQGRYQERIAMIDRWKGL
jgi:ribose 5-phosphate isomerase B